MTASRFAYHFVCRNSDCRQPTELPSAIREEIQSRQTLSPKGTASQGILCPSCKHAFAYTLQDIQPRPAPNQDLYQARNAMSFRRIELECDGEGCGTPVQLIAPWLYGLQPGEKWPTDNEVATWTMHDARCPNGHRPKFPLKILKA